MSVEQVCLIVVLNLLIGTFIAYSRKIRATASASLILLVMILAGFAMIFRSLIV